MNLWGRARGWVYSVGRALVAEFRIVFAQAEGSSMDVVTVCQAGFAMLSHPGRVRKGNEDTCAADHTTGAFLVCDGMGGAAAGEVASSLASEAFLHALRPVPELAPRLPTPDVRLHAAIRAANAAVFQHSRGQPGLAGMGTTLVALLLEPATAPGAPSLTLAHVGDSRCYRFRRGRLEPLTSDHSLVEEQVQLGELTPEEAENHPMRNIITRAVGSQSAVEPEIRHLAPEPGDVYLLASDGLTRELSDTAIARTITRAEAREQIRTRTPLYPLHGLCKTLIDQANDAGGGDNITVLLLRIA